MYPSCLLHGASCTHRVFIVSSGHANKSSNIKSSSSSPHRVYNESSTSLQVTPSNHVYRASSWSSESSDHVNKWSNIKSSYIKSTNIKSRLQVTETSRRILVTPSHRTSSWCSLQRDIRSRKQVIVHEHLVVFFAVSPLIAPSSARTSSPRTSSRDIRSNDHKSLRTSCLSKTSSSSCLQVTHSSLRTLSLRIFRHALVYLVALSSHAF